MVETTLLRGRAQWEKPESVSVPDHIESMIASYREKKVTGVFIAEKLDPNIMANLIMRGISKGYEVIPMEASEFLNIIKLMGTSAKGFWRVYLNRMWNIHKRVLVKK